MASSWDAPLPFIESINGRLKVNTQTAAKLDKIDKPMVIVCIAGLYRTGKSYLMNRLAGTTSGFSLGSTVESHTKGIWVWHVIHPYDPSKALLLMDTEGLGDAFKGDKTYDVWICCLSVLLSSVFVYNIIGKIEAQVIDELYFVTEMSKQIKTKTNASSDIQFDEFFPQFILAIRDFFLEPKIQGVTVTADEYMEQMMLSLKQSKRKIEEDRNQIKKKIRCYFKNRKCFFFPRPTFNDKDLRNIENIPDVNLQKDFINCTNEFCRYIFTTAPVKKVDTTQSVVGRVLTQLAEEYVDAIEKGAVPCIESTISAIAQKENNRVIEESCELYKNQMIELLKFPVTHEHLMLVHQNCYKCAVDCFLSKVFLDRGKEYHAKLQERLNDECSEFVKMNVKASKDKCTTILQKLFITVDEKLRSSKYITPGGFQQYEEDISRIKRQYDTIPEKGVVAEEVLCEILKKREIEKEMILLADASLTEKEKQMQAEKLKKEQIEKEIELHRKELEELEKHKEYLMNAHKEHLQSLIDKYKKEMEIQNQKHEELMQARIAEQERLFQEGFEKDSHHLKEQINTLEKDQKGILSRVFGTVTNVGSVVFSFLPHPVCRLAGIGLGILSSFFR